MARIRTVKPEFFTSEDIVALSPLARLLYIALWCEADKEGRLVWKPTTFKLRYLPADNCDIAALCAELVNGGQVVLYGIGLAYIPRFNRHQHVNPRESESDLPAPPGVINSGPRKVGKNTREAVFERDGYRCVRCGSGDRLEADHILPQSCGGPHIAENLRTLCKSCNTARPVAGQALVDDLKKDGFTVGSLRVKFGIDASILDLHTQGGREGKGKEGKENPSGSTRASKQSPPNFAVTDEMRAWAATKTPGADIDSETEAFRDHTFATACVDWPGRWRNWMRRAGKPAKTGKSFRERDSDAKAARYAEMTGGLVSAKPTATVIEMEVPNAPRLASG